MTEYLFSTCQECVSAKDSLKLRGQDCSVAFAKRFFFEPAQSYASLEFS